MNRIKDGLTSNVLWGLVAGARALYNVVTRQGSSKRAVLVEDVTTEIASEAFAQQANVPEASHSLVALAQRVAPLSEERDPCPQSQLLESVNLYSDPLDKGGLGKMKRAAWAWPFGIGAAGAAIPLITGGPASAKAGTAAGAESATSAFGYMWSQMSSAAQFGVAAVGVLGALYTAYKIHQAWKKYWEGSKPVNPSNNNTNTLTNTMHINLQTSPGMRIVKTVKGGQEVIEIQSDSNEKWMELMTKLIEEMQAQRKAAAAA